MEAITRRRPGQQMRSTQVPVRCARARFSAASWFPPTLCWSQWRRTREPYAGGAAARPAQQRDAEAMFALPHNPARLPIKIGEPALLVHPGGQGRGRKTSREKPVGSETPGCGMGSVRVLPSVPPDVTPDALAYNAETPAWPRSNRVFPRYRADVRQAA